MQHLRHNYEYTPSLTSFLFAGVCVCVGVFVFLFQSSAIVIRGLATGEIRTGNRMRVVWREARAAVASAIVLSVASFFRVLLTPGATTVATLAVSTAMGATVIGAVMFGTIAPIVLDGMGVSSGINIPVRSILTGK